MQVVFDPITSSQDSPVRVSTRRRVTPEEYRAFCEANPDLRIERSAEGELLLTGPAHSRSGAQNAALNYQVYGWALRDGTGISFDSSAGFDLPNGSNRSPDASWVLKSRLATLHPGQREEYFEICPDFVVELRSSSDRIPELQAKMQDYLASGARLGWLIDPLERRIRVYRPGQEVEVLDDPATLSAAPLMPGFILDLAPIWNPQV
jgi:Uma2 family endonuclease